MRKLKDYSGTVYGGLGHLLLTFCNKKDIPIPEKLIDIQNFERFDYSIWRELLNDFDEQLNIPALGLEIAKFVQPKHLGILAYIALSCENLVQALYRYHDFHRLIFDGTPLILEPQQNNLSIRWDELPMHMTTQITDEIAIALMIQFFKLFMSFEQIHLQEIHFQHSAPKNIAIYEQYFHCKVKFSQPKTQVLIPLFELRQPLKQSDQTLQNILMQQAQSLLEQLPNTTQIDQRIQQAIVLGLQKNKYQIEHIANQLHMSVRQLQRYLQQQNTTYQQRMQNIRCVLAQQYLRDIHFNLQEIALLLGYSEQSAFQRAFKHWTQLTPQQWRKINLN
jgi:AraC-like DNA-binding protein